MITKVRKKKQLILNNSRTWWPCHLLVAKCVSLDSGGSQSLLHIDMMTLAGVNIWTWQWFWIEGLCWNFTILFHHLPHRTLIGFFWGKVQVGSCFNWVLVFPKWPVQIYYYSLIVQSVWVFPSSYAQVLTCPLIAAHWPQSQQWWVV